MIDFVKETKLTELENKIPDISNLATKTALTTVENKIQVILFARVILKKMVHKII